MLEAEQRALEALKARGAAPPEAAPSDARGAGPPDADVRTETAVKRLKELEPSIRAVRWGGLRLVQTVEVSPRHYGNVLKRGKLRTL